MNFSLGLVKSKSQISVLNFNRKEQAVSCKTIDIVDFEQENFQILFYDPSLENDEVLNYLKKQQQYYPIINAGMIDLTVDRFQNLDFTEGFSLTKNFLSKWLLKTNLSTLSEIFELTSHLKTLWKGDRYAFFHELSYLLRNNLAAPEMKIIFHDVIEKKDEHDKDKLIFSALSGGIRPEIKALSNPEQAIYQKYEKQCQDAFSVAECFPEKGDLLLLSMIDKSPIVMMVKFFEFNPLQQTLLATIMKELSTKPS